MYDRGIWANEALKQALNWLIFSIPAFFWPVHATNQIIPSVVPNFTPTHPIHPHYKYRVSPRIYYWKVGWKGRIFGKFVQHVRRRNKTLMQLFTPLCLFTHIRWRHWKHLNTKWSTTCYLCCYYRKSQFFTSASLGFIRLAFSRSTYSEIKLICWMIPKPATK